MTECLDGGTVEKVPYLEGFDVEIYGLHGLPIDFNHLHLDILIRKVRGIRKRRNIRT
jgi:hypothetical protein